MFFFSLNNHLSFDIDPAPVVLLVVEGGPLTVRKGIEQ
jgi:hypothetical protein